MSSTALFPPVVCFEPGSWHLLWRNIHVENSDSVQISHAPHYFSLLLCFKYFSYKYHWVENLLIPSCMRKPPSSSLVHASAISIHNSKQIMISFPALNASWIMQIILVHKLFYIYTFEFPFCPSLLPVMSLKWGDQNGTCSSGCGTIHGPVWWQIWPSVIWSVFFLY